jgi:hypothetical protein
VPASVGDDTWARVCLIWRGREREPERGRSRGTLGHTKIRIPAMISRAYKVASARRITIAQFRI